MRATFSEGCESVTFYRESGDPRFHGLRFAKGEHALFRFIARWLDARGFDVIKKRAQKDGHLIGDQYQPYLRCSKPRAGGRMLSSGRASTPFTGRTRLEPRRNLPAPGDRLLPEREGNPSPIAALCGKHPDEMALGDRHSLHDLQPVS